MWSHNTGCGPELAGDILARDAQYQLMKRQYRLQELRTKHGDVFRQRMADATMQALPYAPTRAITEFDFQHSIVKSIRRQYEKVASEQGIARQGVNLNFGNALPNWNQTQIRAYQRHLGEQILELNRLSLFSPNVLRENIRGYQALEAAGMIDYMRRQAGRRMLGPKPATEYVGQTYAAGHTLDSVAGGHYWRFIGWRDGVANSTIGSRWGAGRVTQIVPGQFHWGN